MSVYEGKCPHCGALVALDHELTAVHIEGGAVLVRWSPEPPAESVELCAGSRQIPRAPSDRRRLWRDGGEP